MNAKTWTDIYEDPQGFVARAHHFNIEGVVTVSLRIREIYKGPLKNLNDHTFFDAILMLRNQIQFRTGGEVRIRKINPQFYLLFVWHPKGIIA